MKRLMFCLFALTLLLGAPEMVKASFYLSTQNDATLGGLTFEDHDVVKFDQATDTATLFWQWPGAAAEDIDAVHILGDNRLFSTTTGFSLDNQNFDNEDVVQYNTATGTASVFLDHSDIYDGLEDIDAFSIYNGRYYASTETFADLVNPKSGSPTRVEEGDIAVYDPVSGEGWLMEIFGSAPHNIDALHILAENDIILSTADAASLGGLDFEPEDLVRYNPSTGEASLYFDGDAFSLVENIDAVYVPLPGAIWLLGSGLIGLMGVRRNRRS